LNIKSKAKSFLKRSLVNKTNFGRETFQQQGYEEHEGEENNPPNIDIARDYLLYSASKTHKTDDQKSFSNMNLSAFEDQEEYIQVFFLWKFFIYI